MELKLPHISSDHPLYEVHHSSSRQQGSLPAVRVDVQTVKLSRGLLQLGEGHLLGGLQQLQEGLAVTDPELLH